MMARQLLVGLLLATVLSAPVLAGDAVHGVALVIGESDYAALTDLPNPKQDARFTWRNRRELIQCRLKSLSPHPSTERYQMFDVA